jgi:hypothetical protein
MAAASDFEPPDICPVCDTPVPERARACPHCGADESTGWSDSAKCQRLGIPDDEPFDAEEFAEEEFGEPRSRRLPWIWIVTGIGVLAAFLIPAFRHFFP